VFSDTVESAGAYVRKLHRTAELVSIPTGRVSGESGLPVLENTPGLRYFEKRAVKLGGGDMHRLRLDDPSDQDNI